MPRPFYCNVWPALCSKLGMRRLCEMSAKGPRLGGPYQEMSRRSAIMAFACTEIDIERLSFPFRLIYHSES